MHDDTELAPSAQVAFEPWHWRFVSDSDSWAIFAPVRAYAAGGSIDTAAVRGLDEPTAMREKAMLVRVDLICDRPCVHCAV